MDNYRIIICVYGNKYVGMLIAALYSVIKNKITAKVSVFWQDIDENIQKDIKNAFDNVEFIETQFNFESDITVRISSKVLLWSYAAEYYCGQNICIVDVDTLVIRNINKFFSEEFDVAFTYKDEQFPLNSGVLLAKGDKSTYFFRKWRVNTVKIIQDPMLFAEANNMAGVFGGADQMSLYRMLGYNKEKVCYESEIDGVKLFFKGYECKYLNETNSKKIEADTFIIHYKGGWQPILLEGHLFTKNRKKHDSMEMYKLYLRTYLGSIDYLNCRTKKSYSHKKLGIVVPFYINKITGRENEILYHLYVLKIKLIKLINNIYRALYKRIGLGR